MDNFAAKDKLAIAKGCYVVSGEGTADAIIIATGSEVELAIKAAAAVESIL